MDYFLLDLYTWLIHMTHSFHHTVFFLNTLFTFAWFLGMIHSCSHVISCVFFLCDRFYEKWLSYVYVIRLLIQWFLRMIHLGSYDSFMTPHIILHTAHLFPVDSFATRPIYRWRASMFKKKHNLVTREAK